MTKIHYEIEILYETMFATLCGATPTNENATTEWDRVTCKKCRELANYSGESPMTDMDKMMIEKLRPKMIDWLNAFKADPFANGADKVDRLFEVLSENAAITAYNPDDSREELKHDLKRQMTIANIECNEVERLREAATAFLAEADAGHVTVETDSALRSALSPLPQALK